MLPGSRSSVASWRLPSLVHQLSRNATFEQSAMCAIGLFPVGSVFPRTEYAVNRLFQSIAGTKVHNIWGRAMNANFSVSRVWLPCPARFASSRVARTKQLVRGITLLGRFLTGARVLKQATCRDKYDNKGT